MTTQYSKEQIIQAGLDRGFNARQMDKLLSNFGYGKYNPLTYSKNYTNIPGNFISNAQDLGRGLTTVAGEFIKPIQDVTAAAYTAPSGIKMKKAKEAFLHSVNKDRVKGMITGTALGALGGSIIPGIGTIGGALTGGIMGLVGPKNFGNAILSTYGTNIDDIQSGNVDPRDIAQGVMNNPLWVGMDVAGVGGIGKSIGKGAKSLASKSGMSQQLLTGENLADFNRQITNEKLWSRVNAGRFYGGYNELVSMPKANRIEIYKNIAFNTGKLNEKEKFVADSIKADLVNNQRQLINLGMQDATQAKNDVIAQYVVGKLLDKSDIIHKDVIDIINNRKLGKRAKIVYGNNLKPEISKLIKEAEDLYDNDKIAFVSQEFANTVDPRGEVIARHVNLENTTGKYPRVIGRATPEQLADVLDETLKHQLDKVAYVSEGFDVFKELINSKRLGVTLTPEEKKLFIDKFRDSINKDIQNGLYPSLSKALENSAIDTKLDANIYKAMEGAFEIPTIGMGGELLNYWKKSVLATPTWALGNRLGNWSLNAIEGVMPWDYSDVRKYKEMGLIPDVLKQQTAFNSYVNIGQEVLSKTRDLPSAVKEPLSQIRSAIGRYKQSKKTLSDFGRLASGLYGGTSNLFANPVFRFEAGLEFKDRAANYIRQAKREAKATGKSVEEVLRQAKKDKDLFLKLNTQVNKSLGDYLGRNYAAPRAFREATSWLVPFYRFPAQTIRTSLHGIANRPLGFATNVTLPGRAGADLSNKYQEIFGINKDEYQGGVPYYVDPQGRFIRTISMTPTPLAMMGNRLTRPDELANMLNPSTSNIMDALTYKKFGKVVTSPTLSRLKLTDPKTASEYKGNASDRLKYALHMLLSSTYSPYINISRFGPEILALYRGQGYNTPYGMNPFKQDIVGSSYKKTSPLEILGNLLNISTKSQYIDKNSKSKTKRYRNIQRNAIQNIRKNTER